MDNVKITISQEKIYIKKGIIKLKFLYSYLFYFLLMSIIYFIVTIKKEKQINNKYLLYLLENFNDALYLIFMISFLIFIICLSVFLFSYFRNMHLETISVSQNIKIRGIDYEITLDYIFLKEIIVARYYRANYNFWNRGSYYSHFRDKCTIIFITQNDEEYEWGFKLSYQKGMEIKKMIEERMALNLSKKNENV
ncbi:hypothetical protein [Fusobacterium necrophorum]|uniref:hypothetical protein n=1 Tax=Fusobacterium necrophorum TaxID=859 RepID=UPI00370EA020